MLLYLLLSITTTHSQVVDCGTDPECNCPVARTGETCVLSCNDADICKGKTLNCRHGDPCEIKCRSSATCSDGTTINAQTATDVTITCQGDNACKVEIDIFCGTGDCILLCDGETSCVDWGYIDVSLSTSFECIGDCPKALPYSFTSSPTPIPSTVSSTVPSTSTAIIYASISPTHSPTNSPSTYWPSYYIQSSTDTYKDDDNHYLFDPLFYASCVFFLLIFCGCCIFCIWIYCKEEQQKRIEFKAKSISSIHMIDPEYPEASIESSDLYNNNNDDDEGPVPTHLKIQTVDIVSHCSLMHPNNNIPKIEIPNHALPDLPPPRSLPTPLSPWSSPPQTPIPNEVNISHIEVIEPGAVHHHGQYASLPTVPSLPSITNELREMSTSSVTEINVNNMRVSMVSCMVLEDDSHEDNSEEQSESIEYQSHRRRTYESYDLGHSPFSVGNITKHISVPIEIDSAVIDNYTKTSTIKLHGIREASRDNISISKSFESLSETSVSIL